MIHFDVTPKLSGPIGERTWQKVRDQGFSMAVVVAQSYQDVRSVHVQQHRDAGGRGVAAHVGQRFVHHVQHGFGGGAAQTRGVGGEDVDLQAVQGLETLGLALKRELRLAYPGSAD